MDLGIRKGYLALIVRTRIIVLSRNPRNEKVASRRKTLENRGIALEVQSSCLLMAPGSQRRTGGPEAG